MKAEIKVDRKKLADLCRRYRARKLAFFGSILRKDFKPDSDIDVLVEFQPGATIGFLGLANMELELSKILNHRVDLRTPGELSRYFRKEVLEQAEVQYVQG